jgi:hypothetical protein
MEKKTIINCHTHIFIGDNVPPYLAKKYLIWLFYLLLNVSFLIRINRFWFLNKRSPYKIKFTGTYKNYQRKKLLINNFIERNFITKYLFIFVRIIVTAHCVLYLLQLVKYKLDYEFIFPKIGSVIDFSIKNLPFFNPSSLLIKFIIVVLATIYIGYVRKIFVFILKQTKTFFSGLLNSNFLVLLSRYLNIGRFANYKSSSSIFEKLSNQYPEGSRLIVLPMDMEFMEAGKLNSEGSFKKQMNSLYELKNSPTFGKYIEPFLFVDPRRTQVEGQPFFKWKNANNGIAELESCFVKDYLETKNFSGIKIYPALGYYPFEEVLLPLWKYAADHQIPIMTHCIRGTIFYRGEKKKEWNYHTVFKEVIKKDDYKDLLLPQTKNVDFSTNFTHPLNYLCLVEEQLLRVLVSKCSTEIKILFGFTNCETKMSYDLSHLKICFGHYGGDDEWRNYFEKDRDVYGSQLNKKPTHGITFIKGDTLNESYGVLENIWKFADWYSIISSMILQYDNLYADISYIIHERDIFPLLKQTLKNDKLKVKVLFGTDFYVVRNHNSEKELFSNAVALLNEQEFDFIARENPLNYLKKI